MRSPRLLRWLIVVAGCLAVAVWALRRGAAWCFALCGLFAGLAYLTRPEGLLLVAVVAGVLLLRQAPAAWRRPWRSYAACTASLARQAEAFCEASIRDGTGRTAWMLAAIP